MTEISVIILSSIFIWLMPEDTTAQILFISMALISLMQKAFRKRVR